MSSIHTDFSNSDERPYFLWDEDMTLAEFRKRLQGASEWERDRLLGKLLREANDADVWHFVRPSEVAAALPRIERRLGRRARFWKYLIAGWKNDGLLR
ncbi:MAG: hypothetical protein KBF88_09055 [Polyangiaceae bacterium]|nr:hypothetical protein [Polyangiaceae bacterium]